MHKTYSILHVVLVILCCLSFVYGAKLIADAIQAASLLKDSGKPKALSSAMLLTDEEAASYVGLPETDFKELVKKSEAIRKKLSAYDTHRYISFFQINGHRYYSKSTLDQWIDFHMFQSRGKDPFSS
ncbi:helix-turn-helix domain-containing protein [Paenibacillus sp. MZ04-78.2]|uniref:helix-turn-helix domain-containing protein n=1 Tax=Paenibacillus sp. MZ04-78.2 TaxID=2962034 RepID=UPI0020B7FFB9|nr:helix-turn-helix domain-containing protein [Paenibacillus sp. MZ04-78.2]MCP3773032.1 helix-turn-helix domain-containing protein [Paenibacillus sp. MZ04-78.2]